MTRPALVWTLTIAILATAFGSSHAPLASATGATCTEPGPDRAGYKCAVTTYSWTSMAGATTVSLGEGQTSGGFGLPFGFNHFDTVYSTAYISASGGVCFTLSWDCGGDWARSLWNTNAAVYCLDERLDPAAGGTIKVKSTPSQWTVEFSNVPIAWGGSAQTFQIQLLSSGESRCMYSNVNAVGSVGATSGAGRIPAWSQSTFVAYAHIENVVATNVGTRFYCTSATSSAVEDFRHTDWYPNGPGYLSLAWGYPTNDGCHRVTHYNIYRGTSTSNLQLYDTYYVDPGSMDGVWTDWGVPQGATVVYGIRPVTARGNGALSTLTFNPPTAPEGVQALPTADGIGTVKVSWQSPVDGGGIDLTHYTIWRGPNLNNLQPIATVPGWRTEYVDTAPFGLQIYKVQATNPIGSSALSTSFGAAGSVQPPDVFDDTQIADLGKNTIGPFAPLPITGSNCVWFDLGPITIYGSRFQNGNPTTWINPGTPLLFGDHC